MIGPKSGAPTVRRIIQTYKQINELIGGFLEDGGLLLADECDVLDGFNCTGGVFADERRRLTMRVSDSMSQVFEFEDPSFLPMTPSHLIELERGLQSSTCTPTSFVIPDCVGTCTGCTGTTKVTCQKNYLFCKGRSVNGLTFPFMSDLTSVVGLLSGGDIVSKIRFETAVQNRCCLTSLAANRRLFTRPCNFCLHVRAILRSLHAPYSGTDYHL